MPRGQKGKFPAELTAKDAPAATPERKITPEDMLIAQITLKDNENANLRLQLMNTQIEQQKRILEEAQKNLKNLNDAINKKYNVDQATEVINVMTGVISKRV